jgi:hypothetical protein
MSWARYIALIVGMRNAYKIFVWKREEKRSPGRTRYICEENIVAGLKLIENEVE